MTSNFDYNIFYKNYFKKQKEKQNSHGKASVNFSLLILSVDLILLI